MRLIVETFALLNIWLIKKLILSKKLYNFSFLFGHTPLHCGSAQGHLIIVEFLIHYEAELNAKDIQEDLLMKMQLHFIMQLFMIILGLLNFLSIKTLKGIFSRMDIFMGLLFILLKIG